MNRYPFEEDDPVSRENPLGKQPDNTGPYGLSSKNSSEHEALLSKIAGYLKEFCIYIFRTTF